MKDHGNSEQEVVFQRFDFHSNFILVEKEEDIDLQNLINREEEWIAINFDKINNNPETFRQYNFIGINFFNFNFSFKFMFNCILSFLIGFFGLFFVFLPIIFCKKLSNEISGMLVIGFCIKIFYIALNSFAFQRTVYFV